MTLGIESSMPGVRGLRRLGISGGCGGSYWVINSPETHCDIMQIILLKINLTCINDSWIQPECVIIKHSWLSEVREVRL